MHEKIQLACKCMGKYQDGPNVRVVSDTDNVMTDSVRELLPRPFV